MVIFLGVSMLLSASQTFKYSASVKLLTINTFNNSDPYTVSRSNEYLGGLLAQITSSNSFFEKVKNINSTIDVSYFGDSSRKQIKKWGNTVKARSLGDNGVIVIDVYHPDKSQAVEIARAVAYVLQTDNAQYHGFGDKVQVKIIDEPIASNYPVRPNLFLNFGLALFFGLVFSLSYVYLFPETLSKKSQQVKKAKNNKIVQTVVLSDNPAVESLYPEMYDRNTYIGDADNDQDEEYETVVEEKNSEVIYDKNTNSDAYDFEGQADMKNVLSR
jgi:capsular polysaccharide biosynthesis protein